MERKSGAVMQRFVLIAVAAGVAGGAVDFAYFTTIAIMDGRSPVTTLQGMSSFWLGSSAREGGVASAALGFATHFGLAVVMAIGFLAASRAAPAILLRPVTSGVVYGLFLYGVMYFGVLPMRWPNLYPRFDGLKTGFDILAHVAVGLAIAIVTTAFFSRTAGAK